MSNKASHLARTVKRMRPMVPTKDLELSKRFYVELGFQPNVLAENLIEMELGPFSFILQGYYVQQWADNFVMQLLVSDVRLWWDHIVSLDLTSRYGTKIRAPRQEEWGLVAGVIDPSGILWRIAEASALPCSG